MIGRYNNQLRPTQNLKFRIRNHIILLAFIIDIYSTKTKNTINCLNYFKIIYESITNFIT